MALRYWVGGTGTWDTSATTNWSSSSGGGGGASAPTLLDNVIIDTNSGTGTITCNFGVCGNLSVTATQAISLGNFLTSYANVTFPSGGSFSASNFSLTANTVGGNVTITTNGKTIYRFTASTNTSTVLLGSDLTATLWVHVTAGGFNTNNFNVTCGLFFQSYGGTYAITVTFGSSTFTVNNSNFNIGGTGITFVAGTSTVVFTASGYAVNAASGTSFYNLTLDSSATGGTQTLNCAGCTITNNLTLSAPPGSGVNTVSVATSAPLTVSGTLIASTATTRRVFLKSSLPTTQATISVAAGSVSDFDFQDINITGAVSPLTGSRFGDCKNNSGITFPAAKTVYWNLAGSQNWRDTGWATSSGGAPAVNNFPLAQDTAIFDDTGSADVVLINDSWNIGTINSATRTIALTLQIGNNFNVYGDITLGSGITLSYTAVFFVLNIVGRTTQTITSNGKFFLNPISVNSPGGTLTFVDDFYISGGASSGVYLGIASGTIDANNRNLTMPVFKTESSSLAKTITMGSGTWTIYGNGTAWDATTRGSSLTVNANTSTINLALGAVSNSTFIGGGKTYNNLNFGGVLSSTTYILSDVNTFNTVSSTRTIAFFITLTANQTVANWTANGTAGNIITLRSNVNGVQRTITKTGGGTITVYYYDIRDSNAQPASTWYAPGSVNSGNNTGWFFFNAYTDAVTENITYADSSLARDIFSRAVIENIVSGDSPTVTAAFISSRTEAIVSIGDILSAGVTFVKTISEGFTLEDSPTGGGIYPINISESITLDDIEAAVKVYNATAVEPVNVADVAQLFGFGTIDNTQDIVWVPIDNRQ